MMAVLMRILTESCHVNKLGQIKPTLHRTVNQKTRCIGLFLRASERFTVMRATVLTQSTSKNRHCRSAHLIAESLLSCNTLQSLFRWPQRSRWFQRKY